MTHTIKFQPNVRLNMKEYMHFLFWHHNYSEEKLLATFPEYFTKTPAFKRMRRWYQF